MNCRTSRWRYADSAAEKLLGGTPEFLLENAEIIKRNPVRKVFRSGEFYLKIDSRPGHRLHREFYSALRAGASGIPVVDHLACGRIPAGEVLVTRALPDAASVEERLTQLEAADEKKREEFLNEFADFVRKVLSSGMFHPDFHIGNVLHSTSSGFALVDLHGVRKAGWMDRMFRSYRMQRIILETRQLCSRRRMIELVGRSGIADPETFYRKGLHREALALWREWPKRKRQILSGYPKFCIRNGTRLISVIPGTGQTADVSQCEVISAPLERLEKLFLAHFFLQLARIAHRQVAAFDPECGKLWIAPVSPLAMTGAPADFQEQLEALDIQTEPSDWIEDRRSIQIFTNLDRIAKHI